MSRRRLAVKVLLEEFDGAFPGVAGCCGLVGLGAGVVEEGMTGAGVYDDLGLLAACSLLLGERLRVGHGEGVFVFAEEDQPWRVDPVEIDAARWREPVEGRVGVDTWIGGCDHGECAAGSVRVSVYA